MADRTQALVMGARDIEREREAEWEREGERKGGEWDREREIGREEGEGWRGTIHRPHYGADLLGIQKVGKYCMLIQ